MKVLVVDDDADLRRFTSRVFKKLGYEPLMVSSGQEALDILHEHADVSIVLLDVNLEGLSGLDIYKIICQDFLKVRVILSSGDPYCSRHIARLCDVFLSKPYDVTALDTCLRLGAS